MSDEHTDESASNYNQSESSNQVDRTVKGGSDDATTQDDRSSKSTSTASHDDDIEDEELDDAEFPEGQRSVDIKYSTPVDDVHELECFGYIERLLREANLEDPTPRKERTVEREFDSRILDYAPDSLGAAGLPLDADEWPISTGYVQALVLYSARGCGFREFADHLDNMEETRQRLNLKNGRSKSKLSGENCELTDDQPEIIKKAAYRALHTAFRAGVQFPEDVWDRYAAKDEPLSPVATGLWGNIEEGNIPQRLKDKALDNWAELFLEECMLPTIDFDRTNPQYPVASMIGHCANAAIQGESLNDASKTGGRIVGYEPVSSADAVLSPIRNMSVGEINEMFRDVRAEFFDIAADYGVFEDPSRLAYDLTDVPRYAPEIDDQWVKGNAPTPKGDVEPAETDQKWEYGLLSIAEPGLYFALGLHPFKSGLDEEFESSLDEEFDSDLNLGTLLRQMLQPVLEDLPLDVELLIMDQELYSNEVVKKCRRPKDVDWMLLAPNGYVEDIIAEVPEGKADYIDSDNVDLLNELDRKPNAVVVPLHPSESNTDSSHLVFLTDLAEDEVNLTKLEGISGDQDNLFADYQDRNHIEHTIGRHKDDFDVPHNDNVSTEVEYFLLQLSQLFYNTWVLINHARSPGYGFPVGAKEFASANEVLQAFREVAYEKAAAEMEAR